MTVKDTIAKLPGLGDKDFPFNVCMGYNWSCDLKVGGFSSRQEDRRSSELLPSGCP